MTIREGLEPFSFTNWKNQVFTPQQQKVPATVAPKARINRKTNSVAILDRYVLFELPLIQALLQRHYAIELRTVENRYGTKLLRLCLLELLVRNRNAN